MFVQRHWIRQTFSYNKHFICKVLSRNNFGSQNLLICISITLIGTLCAPKKSDKLALYPYCAAWKNRCTESNRINHKQNVSALFSSALLLRRWAREIQKYVAVAAYCCLKIQNWFRHSKVIAQNMKYSTFFVVPFPLKNLEKLDSFSSNKFLSQTLYKCFMKLKISWDICNFVLL